MNRKITLRNGNCVLRNVELPDAAFIVKLRRLPHTKGKIGDTSSSLEAQENWLRGYFERDNDYYFIVEDANGNRVGTHAVYDIEGNTGTIGRWVFEPGTNLAVHAHLMLLQYCFETLMLERLVFTVVDSNRKVIRFHHNFGAVETGMDEETIEIDGVERRQLKMEYRKCDWTATRKKLEDYIS